MNTSSKAKRILCFGDSNTWGFIPGLGDRYPIEIRWPGVLQNLLGSNFEIIEEGLNARTTELDDPKNFGKNGIKYLPPCLQTHSPIDSVILFLGTNDLKERFNRTPNQIRDGIENLILTIKNDVYTYNHEPKIILIAPTIVDESAPKVKEKYLGAEEKSRQLGNLYFQLSEKYGTKFIDLAKNIKPSNVDGYHLSEESHQKIAKLLFDLIQAS